MSREIEKMLNFPNGPGSYNIGRGTDIHRHLKRALAAVNGDEMSALAVLPSGFRKYREEVDPEVEPEPGSLEDRVVRTKSLKARRLEMARRMSKCR